MLFHRYFALKLLISTTLKILILILKLYIRLFVDRLGNYRNVLFFFLFQKPVPLVVHSRIEVSFPYLTSKSVENP